MPEKKLSQNLKKKVIKVAEKLFLKHGYNKTGIRDIAKECNISVGLIYKLFKSKEDLFAHILRYHLENTLKEIEKSISKTSSFKEKLYAFLDNFISQFHQREKFFYLFLTSLGNNFLVDKNRFQVQDISYKLSELLCNILEEGKKEGYIDKNENVYFLSKYILGGIINTIYGYVVEKNQKLPDNFKIKVKDIIDKILNLKQKS